MQHVLAKICISNLISSLGKQALQNIVCITYNLLKFLELYTYVHVRPLWIALERWFAFFRLCHTIEVPIHIVHHHCVVVRPRISLVFPPPKQIPLRTKDRSCVLKTSTIV